MNNQPNFPQSSDVSNGSRQPSRQHNQQSHLHQISQFYNNGTSTQPAINRMSDRSSASNIQTNLDQQQEELFQQRHQRQYNNMRPGPANQDIMDNQFDDLQNFEDLIDENGPLHHLNQVNIQQMSNDDKHDIQTMIQMRKKLNNSEIKRNSSQSIVNFNGNRAINEFKQSIPSLNIPKNANFQRGIKRFDSGAPGAQGYNNIDTDHKQSQDQSNIMAKQRDLHTASRTGQIIMNIETKDMLANKLDIRSPNQKNDLLSMTHSRQSIRDNEIHQINSDQIITNFNTEKRQQNNERVFGNFAMPLDYPCDGESQSVSQQSQSIQLQLPQVSKGKNRQHGANISNSIPSFNFNTMTKEQAESDFKAAKEIQAMEERPEGEEISPSAKKESRLADQQQNNSAISNLEIKSATLQFEKLLKITQEEEPDRPTAELKSALYPPPEEIYRSKLNVKHQDVNFGLNMYFKKYHEFSQDGDQGGGDLAPNQTFLSMPWGVNGCPPAKQEDLTSYVIKNIKNIVFCRYGIDYLRSFPRVDDLQIGSYRINLDNLIFQRQKNLDNDSNSHLLGMNFLKTKGQVEMNKRMKPSPVKKGEGNQTIGIAQTPNLIINPYYKASKPDDSTTLRFDSVFESGNLAIAIKVSDTEYNCLLQNDINTNGHTQWFYFRVNSKFRKKTSVKFNLINLYKPKSLYQYGLRVCTLDVSDQTEVTEDKNKEAQGGDQQDLNNENDENQDKSTKKQ